MARDAPTLLLTRPEAAAQDFLRALPAEIEVRYRVIISPLFDYAPVNHAPIDRDADVVLTSAAAVPHAGPGAGRAAWCVGDRTAMAAREAGFETRNARGDAEALVALILAKRPAEPLVHVRGADSRGQIRDRLAAAGVTCEERIVYEKVPRDLTPPARAALMGRETVVLPLFSPETARILAQQGPFSAPPIVVAMSGAVAEAARPLDADRVEVADTPDLAGMVQGVAKLDA
ncbi:uroporphyrinogen-III synthase [Salibaculum halophilum]|uniref:uroporphyrinogen-III synthase n=1 Tax=Salibaculum halophilum TaxID=1914408 RepID=UPI0015C42E89|nr:uroporphyrinogen-III synthase [Salibaculum halophilum]